MTLTQKRILHAIQFGSCSQLISIGEKGSYEQEIATQGLPCIPANHINTGAYSEFSIVGVLVHCRTTRWKESQWCLKGEVLLDKAIRANALIVTDNPKRRDQRSNVGQRKVGEYLEKKGYVEDGINNVRSLWRPSRALEQGNEEAGIKSEQEVIAFLYNNKLIN